MDIIDIAIAKQLSGGGSGGGSGTDGFSPVVTVSEIEGGHSITIQDKTTTNTFNVMDGTDGKDGSDAVYTFDSTPTAGSTNPVTSGGVYTAIAAIEQSGGTDINEYIIDNFESSKNGTNLSTISGVRKTNDVVENQDGSITIPVSGYWWPSFRVNGLVTGDLWVIIKCDFPTSVQLGWSNVYNGTGSAPYITTVKLSDRVYYAKIAKSDFKGNGYDWLTVRFDNRSGSEERHVYSVQVYDSHISISGTPVAMYVSMSGNDENDGLTLATAKATVTNAVDAGASTVLMDAGIYNERINLGNLKHDNITIKNISAPSGRVIFRNPNATRTSSDSLLDGYTKVRYAENVTAITAGLNYLYQENINDASTLISDEEVHALQRGQTHRLFDTKIIRCSSTALSDALTEIESDDIYKWFYDTSTSTLYYSSPESASSEHPICKCDTISSILNMPIGITFNAIGIETKFFAFSINGAAYAQIHDCKAAYSAGGGGFIYDNCKSVTFLRCEASGCQTDGFNGHALAGYDTYAKSVDCNLIDCWAHDCGDEGYSDHEKSETLVIGGLYEYNVSAGLTPSGGSSCTCYNVLSRRNGWGFYYTGTVLDGGRCGHMICNGCISENNIGCGFGITGNNNVGHFYNCTSVGDNTGFVSNLATDKIYLTNCNSINPISGKATDGAGTITDITGDVYKQINSIAMSLSDQSVKEVTISDTAPVITAAENTRYICGTVQSLSFTPSVSGLCEVIFTTGATVPTVTFPSTVKMPDWYEVDANTTYEISILNGIYGAVMSWAV